MISIFIKMAVKSEKGKKEIIKDIKQQIQRWKKEN